MGKKQRHWNGKLELGWKYGRGSRVVEANENDHDHDHDPRYRSRLTAVLQSPTRFLHARHFPSKEGLGWIRGRGFT